MAYTRLAACRLGFVLAIAALFLAACSGSSGSKTELDGDFDLSPQSCQADKDCLANEACVGGHCLPQSANPCLAKANAPCVLDSDCLNGRVCDDACTCQGQTPGDEDPDPEADVPAEGERADDEESAEAAEETADTEGESPDSPNEEDADSPGDTDRESENDAAAGDGER